MTRQGQLSRQGQSSRQLGRAYELEAPIGRGAMGEVWRGKVIATGEPIAAKLLRPEYTSEQEVLTRFVQERSILVSLQHPNLVRVRDLVVEGGELAIVMDLVDGTDLRQHLNAHGRLTPAEAVRISAEVLEALAVVHAASVLHRDVKPDNVLLDNSEPPSVRLSDFGIARLAEGTAVRMSQLLGTPEYLAPEVISSELVSPKADVYASAILLYELLAGRTPYAGDGNAYAVMRRHVEAAPPPLPGLPPALWSVLEQLLVKDPAARPDAVRASALLRQVSRQLVGAPPLAEVPVTEWQDARAVGNPRATGTLVPGQRRVPSMVDAESMRAWVPGAPGGAATGHETRANERPLLPREMAPVISADVPAAPEAKGNRRALLVAALGLIVVALVVGLVLVQRDGGGRSSSSGQGSLASPPSYSKTQKFPSGLVEVDRKYTLETLEGGEVVLRGSITYRSSSDLDVSGPVVEALPASLLERSAKPVRWVGKGADVPAERRGRRAGRSAVFWTVSLPPLQDEKAAPVEFELRELDLGDADPEQLLQAGLDGAEADLQGLVRAATPDQEDVVLLALQGVEITPGATLASIDAATRIPYKVDAIFPEERRLRLLEVGDTGPVLASDVLLNRFGGLEALSITSRDGCFDTRDAGRILVPQQAGTCRVEARLARFSDDVSLTVANNTP